MAVTLLDVLRLTKDTGKPIHELVDWLAPDAVDMSGEPDSFLELSEGRRLMVLRQQHGACTLLGADNRCGAYAARPRDCRTFPFDLEPRALDVPRAPRRLSLLPLSGCDYAEDGENDMLELESEDAARFAELNEYRALVRRWNRRAFHRRRLHKSVGDAAAFFEFAQQALPASGESADSKTVP